jgi:hypothetical protein
MNHTQSAMSIALPKDLEAVAVTSIFLVAFDSNRDVQALRF